VRLGLAFVATRCTLEYQRVLAELVAQFVDMEFARHGANCCDPLTARPSSSYDPPTLYELSVARFDLNAVSHRPLPLRPTRCHVPINWPFGREARFSNGYNLTQR
jgi:hypothetical protein